MCSFSEPSNPWLVLVKGQCALTPMLQRFGLAFTGLSIVAAWQLWTGTGHPKEIGFDVCDGKSVALVGTGPCNQACGLISIMKIYRNNLMGFFVHSITKAAYLKNLSSYLPFMPRICIFSLKLKMRFTQFPVQMHLKSQVKWEYVGVDTHSDVHVG
jgi:hypothetical protein